MTALQDHWNAIFAGTADSELGWYEKDAAQTWAFLERIPHRDSATVFLPGAGTTVLVDELLARGHRLILNDISDQVLHALRQRIGARDDITWIHQDIAKPLPHPAPRADIWVDRAVLHFLLEEADIQGYFANLHRVLRTGGYALLAEFATTGAPKCAGLELHRYSVEDMNARIGPSFSLVAHETFTYVNPWGDPRPYIYVLYKRMTG